MIMVFYLLIVGIVILGVELEQAKCQQWFLFLNFGWGKVYLYSFLVCAYMSTPEKSIAEWVITLAFVASSGLSIYIHQKYFDQENERIKQAIEKI